jgi:hypothetical protein
MTINSPVITSHVRADDDVMEPIKRGATQALPSTNAKPPESAPFPCSNLAGRSPTLLSSVFADAAAVNGDGRRRDRHGFCLARPEADGTGTHIMPLPLG